MLEDCFSLSGAYWYGLGEMSKQKWPMSDNSKDVKFPMTAFITNDYLSKNPGQASSIFGGLLEPLIFNNKGWGIYIHDHVPLFISMNDQDSQSI